MFLLDHPQEMSDGYWEMRGGEVSWGGHLKLSDVSHFTEDDWFYQTLNPCLQW